MILKILSPLLTHPLKKSLLWLLTPQGPYKAAMKRPLFRGKSPVWGVKSSSYCPDYSRSFQSSQQPCLFLDCGTHLSTTMTVGVSSNKPSVGFRQGWGSRSLFIHPIIQMCNHEYKDIQNWESHITPHTMSVTCHSKRLVIIKFS